MAPEFKQDFQKCISECVDYTLTVLWMAFLVGVVLCIVTSFTIVLKFILIWLGLNLLLIVSAILSASGSLSGNSLGSRISKMFFKKR